MPLYLPRAVSRESKFSPQQQLTIDNEVRSFLAKGSNLGLSLTLRLLITLFKFKMETVESAIKLMGKSCYMSSIQLRDAFYSVPIAP